ncbi:MBL fold metallo-hydrolase [Undibacterium sp. RTI2.1]|uniref:MBL fold metallo-hydrolase n=1 Tax=unclassified Undibacterium TaxID=2630295 RepID=UPI002B22A2CE|nr:MULTISPECIES: MBL fold metallo-hydrolase [unclassified Undibacterium]MEB0031436.1 MBL fold metallo-hydrolase [Undibacterium sp. RTI2.1]MEB0117732.1 MBL fold metallo-hydrolase [Undibacterium sp. RTI2.2]
MSVQLQSFFDATTCTATYVVFDKVAGKTGGHAAVIDSVLNYDPNSGRTSTAGADQIVEFIRSQQLQLDWILETHAHADHLSAAHYLRQQLGGKIAIGAHIRQVQTVFKKLFHLEPDFAVDGSQFDVLFEEDEEFQIGSLTAKALYVPGHTPADMAYQIGDMVFVGDTLFMPDVGTARCDFPGGDAHLLYRSIQKLLSLPESTRLMMCHDYPPTNRAIRLETSVAEQRINNIHVHDGISEAAFVAMRNKRDAGLEMPILILPSVQINIRAGAFPIAEENGISYLKIPLNGI